jgi:hypothetical protein
MQIKFSNHALTQMKRRDISKKLVIDIITNPGKISNQDNELSIYSKVVNEQSKNYLYRVFINQLKKPGLVVTVYKTSKLQKYGYQI